MFISPVPRERRGGLRRICNTRTLVLAAGLLVITGWILAATIFISNNNTTESMKNSAKSRGRVTGRLRPAAIVHTTVEQTEKKDGLELPKALPEDTEIKPEKQDEKEVEAEQGPQHPDWWASDASLDDKTRERREALKQAFLHTWNGYKKYAWGHDEIKPVSNRPEDGWGHMAATLVDSLDTALIMGFDAEFEEGVKFVETLTVDSDWDASTFETTIRYLGGLLSAYELSGQEILLKKAKELADRMLPAFQTSSGIPYATVNLHTGRAYSPSWAGGSSFLAEFGTLQLEWNKLSDLTKDVAYSTRMDRIDDKMMSADTSQWDGLFPSQYHPDTGRFTSSHITFGARGDSFYEYLLKSWIITGKQRDRLFTAYAKAMEGMKKKLIFKTAESGLTWVAESNGGSLVRKMDHLACFVPGMLALDGIEGHLELAKEMLHTCIEFYDRSPTGLAGEIMGFDENEVKSRGMKDFWYQAPYNLLRPETAESLMVLFRVTGDEQYREAGWRMFQAFEKHCKTDSAFSGLQDVTNKNSAKNDKMESFFLAETLKYLYLLFSPEKHIPLDKFVFTTEAHPLRIVQM